MSNEFKISSNAFKRHSVGTLIGVNMNNVYTHSGSSMEGKLSGGVYEEWKRVKKEKKFIKKHESRIHHMIVSRW